MSSHTGTATGSVCELCGGPCREPFRLPPIHDNYPFLPQEVIAMTQPAEATPEPEQPTGKRAHRPRGNTARHPSENRAHEPGEDR